MHSLVSWEKELNINLGQADWEIRCYDRIDSTMCQAKELLKEKSKTNLLVLAQAQRSARGRLGSEWQTTSGALAATFVLPLEKNINYSCFTLVVGLLLLESINDSQRRVLIKWPNDLWTKNGQKIAGILVEQFQFQENNFLSIGIGMNLESKVPNLNSASLYEAIGIAYHPCDLASRLALKLPSYLKVFEEEGFTAFQSSWNKFSFPIDSEIEALFNQQKILGKYRGVDQQGRILVNINDEEYSFTSLEISKVRYVSS